MKLYGVRIFVDDYAKARAFYAETLGLPVQWEMAEHDVAGFGVGESGSPTPMFILEEEAPDGPYASLIGRFVGVSLEVDDIQATYEALAAKGVSFDAPPEKQFWGGVLAHFKDPAGNTLTLLGS